jgi:hypothetical protein
MATTTIKYKGATSKADLMRILRERDHPEEASRPLEKSSQVNTLPKAKSKTRSKQNKDMHKCSSVYSERGVPLPVLTSGGE